MKPESKNFVNIYDRHLAIQYAHKWAYDRNPAFANFSALGGDCTNFVSQCLLAGGLPMNDSKEIGWYWRNMDDRSPSFTGVQFLFDFLTADHLVGPKGLISPLCDLLPGDIIRISFDGRLFSHCVFIVEITPEKNILVAAHNSDSDRRPIHSYLYDSLRGLAIS